MTDEIKTNKLADTNIINDLLGFSSESQVNRSSLMSLLRNMRTTSVDSLIRYYVNNVIVYQSQKQTKHLSH